MYGKRPLPIQDFRAIKAHLEKHGPLRNLALFLAGIDTVLRQSDLLKLKVEDVTDHTGAIADHFRIKQKKTSRTVSVALSDATKQALREWVEHSGKEGGDYLWTALKGAHGGPISRMQHLRILKGWIRTCTRLDPKFYATHSIRKARPRFMYDEGAPLTAIRNITGHRDIGVTSAYIGVDEDETLDISAQHFMV